MKRIAVPILLALSTGAFADGLKPGLWEFKPVKQIMDGRDMAAEMAAAQAEMQKSMANMPPAQRKQMEAMMQGRGMSPPGAGGVQRICISPAMAARDKPMVDPEGKCEPTKVSRSGNKTSFEFNCTSDGHTMVGKGESTVASDLVTSKMDMTMSDARGRHTMQSETQMKFVSADCGSVKPIDQMSKEMAGRRK